MNINTAAAIQFVRFFSLFSISLSLALSSAIIWTRNRELISNKSTGRVGETKCKYFWISCVVLSLFFLLLLAEMLLFTIATHLHSIYIFKIRYFKLSIQPNQFVHIIIVREQYTSSSSVGAQPPCASFDYLSLTQIQIQLHFDFHTHSII